MIEINFKKRRTKPTNPIAGSFYWVVNDKSDIQIWFSPTDNVDDLILLNEKYPDYSDRIKELQNKDKELEELLKELSEEINNYVTKDELEDRLKDISPNITEEDIEKIVEMVNSKTINLKWTII